MRANLVFGFLLVFGLFSCKKPPQKTASTDLAKEALLQTQELQFRRLMMNGKMTIKGNSLNPNLSIRMVKDSILWASFTGPFNIEGARVKITPDSIHVLDRLNKVYMFGSVASIERLASVELDYAMLQNAIVGNLLFDFNTSKDSLSKDSSILNLYQIRDNFKINSSIDANQNSMSALRVESLDGERLVKAQMRSFMQIDSTQKIPSETHIIIAEPKKAKPTQEVTIYITRAKILAEDESLPINFAIPKSYTIKEL